MDSIDVTDMAFSLASLPDVNDVISSTTEAVENMDLTSDSTNLFFVIGFLILIGGLFFYNYYVNSNKKVTFSEELQQQYYDNTNQ